MFLYIKIHHSSKLVERLKSDVNAVYSFVVYFRSILNSKMADKNEDRVGFYMIKQPVIRQNLKENAEKILRR